MPLSPRPTETTIVTMTRSPNIKNRLKLTPVFLWRALILRVFIFRKGCTSRRSTKIEKQGFREGIHRNKSKTTLPRIERRTANRASGDTGNGHLKGPKKTLVPGIERSL